MKWYKPLRVVSVFFLWLCISTVLYAVLYGLWIVSPWINAGLLLVGLMVLAIYIVATGQSNDSPAWMDKWVAKRAEKQMERAIKQAHKLQAERDAENAKRAEHQLF